MMAVVAMGPPRYRARVCVVLVLAVLAASSAAAAVAVPGIWYKRDQQLTCDDPKNKKPTCNTKCSRRCPDQCVLICPGCKTYCICDFYPGASCGDPRFTGGDGNTFYFHGRKDHDFCILSDGGLHVNAHFIGKRNPAMRRDFTWIQALGIRFAHHRLYLTAQKTARWNADVDRLQMAFDDEDVALPAFVGARWESPAAPGLTVTRIAATNAVRVQLRGVFDIVAKAVPITHEDSRIHNYGVTDDDDDTLAHLDLAFKFYDLTDDVHGVLGQTYRADYVNQLSATSNIPVMGGAPKYVSSNIFATDCAVARFIGATSHAAGIRIAMVTAHHATT